jgi:hypothetical protein
MNAHDPVRPSRPKTGGSAAEKTPTQRGHGDVTSCCFSTVDRCNLRAVETMMEEELGPHEKTDLPLLYADDGRIGGGDLTSFRSASTNA